MTTIWLIDTSVLLNILQIPGRSQNRDDVISTYKQRAANKDTFALPLASIIETGNHIAQLTDGNERRVFAQKLTTTIQSALSSTAPFAPMEFWTKEEFAKWIMEFSDYAQNQISIGDLSIIKDQARIALLAGNRNVGIWSLDERLAAHSKVTSL